MYLIFFLSTFLHLKNVFSNTSSFYRYFSKIYTRSCQSFEYLKQATSEFSKKIMDYHIHNNEHQKCFGFFHTIFFLE